MLGTNAFVASVALPRVPGATVGSKSARRVAVVNAPTPRRAQVSMQEKTKKKAAPVFALDIKGNFVWNLRGAGLEDVPAMASIVKALPESVVSCLVEESRCCTVCEASVKGTKEGEGYSGRVLGAALVDVNTLLRNENRIKLGDFITVSVDPDVPNRQDVSKKLVLGCLKKLKDAGVVECTSDVSAERTERIGFLEECLFTVKEKSDGRVKLSCALSFENPDPQKKIL